MEKRTYREVIDEINRFWDDEMAVIYQDDGFSQAVNDACREVAHEQNIMSDEKNKFYGAVYRILNK